MSDIQFPGGSPQARRNDPKNSWEAAKSVLDVRESQAKVWFTLRRFGPMIDELLIAKMRELGFGMSESGVRSRRNELVEAGLVEDANDDGLTVRGRKSTKWRALSVSEWKARQVETAQQPKLI